MYGGFGAEENEAKAYVVKKMLESVAKAYGEKGDRNSRQR